MEAGSYLIHSARKAGSSWDFTTSQRNTRGWKVSRKLQYGPLLFFSSLAYLFFTGALTRHLHRNLNQPRSFWQKGSYFTISRLVIAERHHKHTPSVPGGLRVLYRPVSRNAATSRERSRFMASPSIRGTLNLSQLTPWSRLARCLRSLIWNPYGTLREMEDERTR